MRALLSATLLLLLLGGPAEASSAVASTPAVNAGAAWAALHLVGNDGKPFDVRRLQGKVVLVVNVASFCSYTPQYGALQELQDTYGPRGLVVVGVPSNQFGGQEPGTDKEIRNFCETRYGVTFPLLQKQDVNGAGRSPLYRWLVGSRPGGGRDVGWNFEKYLVDREGRVIGHWASHVIPKDPHLVAAIEMALSDR